LIKKAKKTNSNNSQIDTGILVLENKKVFKELELAIRVMLLERFALIPH